ncbi:hypothetical protein [Streptomyces sp. NPDC002913]
MTTLTLDHYVITRDGRTLVSRADIAHRYGYPVSTLERWWTNRARNGHPDAADRDGRRLVWDAGEWEMWDRHRLNLRTRAELADAHGLSLSRMDLLWANRDRNGHPPVIVRGRTHCWDAAAWASWYTEYARSEPNWYQPAAHVGAGDPDEEIGPAEFARILGHSGTSWITRAVATPPPGFPAPTSAKKLPSGRERPQWRRRDADAYAQSRAANPPARPGRPKGSTAQPHPYAGDPRLQLARQVLRDHPDETTSQLTRRLDEQSERPTSASAWLKILGTARQHPEDDS